jgi:hypothetical protein
MPVMIDGTPARRNVLDLEPRRDADRVGDQDPPVRHARHPPTRRVQLAARIASLQEAQRLRVLRQGHAEGLSHGVRGYVVVRWARSRLW